MEVKSTYFEILWNTTMRGQPQKRQHGWHLLNMNSMLVSSGCHSRHSYNLRTRSSIQTPLRQLWCRHTPTNLSPRCYHFRASLTKSGPGPGKMDTETDIRWWEHWQLHATVTYSKVTDQIFSLILSVLASFSLFQAFWVSPATAVLKIMKGFYRIKQRFRERRE